MVIIVREVVKIVKLVVKNGKNCPWGGQNFPRENVKEDELSKLIQGFPTANEVVFDYGF